MASGRLVDYLGSGTVAARPASLSLTTGAIGLYYATDTGAISVWDGSAWQTPTIVVADETIDDRVAALLVAGTGMTLTYNDVANTLTVETTITQYTDEMARDALGTALTAGTGVTITPNDGADTITIAVDTTAEAERTRDTIGTALVAGAGITITPNDGADTITIAASGGAASYVKLDQVVLGATAADITFSSISGSYEDLIVAFTGRGTSAATTAQLRAQFNADTGANYDYEIENRYGVVTGAAQTSAYLGDITSSTATASIAAQVESIIGAYARTTFQKNVFSLTNLKITAAVADFIPQRSQANWRSTAAITSIKLFPASGSFAAGTVATLYGRV